MREYFFNKHRFSEESKMFNEALENGKMFLSNDLKADIDYIVKNYETRMRIYYEAELYLRAKFKLKETGLVGTTQEYNSRLNTILKTILKTSTLIETPIEYRFPAPEPAILDNLIGNLTLIIEDKEQVQNLMRSILNSVDFKFRKISSSYSDHIEQIYGDDVEESGSGGTVTPDGAYEIGYTLLPCATKFIIHREVEDFDLNIYMNHPLFYTNHI